MDDVVQYKQGKTWFEDFGYLWACSLCNSKGLSPKGIRSHAKGHLKLHVRMVHRIPFIE